MHHCFQRSAEVLSIIRISLSLCGSREVNLLRGSIFSHNSRTDVPIIDHPSSACHFLDERYLQHLEALLAVPAAKRNTCPACQWTVE